MRKIVAIAVLALAATAAQADSVAKYEVEMTDAKPPKPEVVYAVMTSGLRNYVTVLDCRRQRGKMDVYDPLRPVDLPPLPPVWFEATSGGLPQQICVNTGQWGAAS
jgi:hypothetical protein